METLIAHHYNTLSHNCTEIQLRRVCSYATLSCGRGVERGAIRREHSPTANPQGAQARFCRFRRFWRQRGAGNLPALNVESCCFRTAKRFGEDIAVIIRIEQPERIITRIESERIAFVEPLPRNHVLYVVVPKFDLVDAGSGFIVPQVPSAPGLTKCDFRHTHSKNLDDV